MKRLLLTFGLVVAFFITNVQASTIFDSASYVSPKISSVTLGNCTYLSQLTDYDSCYSATTSQAAYPEQACNDTYVKKYVVTTDYAGNKIITYKVDYCGASGSGSLQTVGIGNWLKKDPTTSTSCPPDESPLYIVDRDVNGDGKIDLCYNPSELDTLSNCQNQLGSILPALNNTAQTVCKTDPNTGTSCGFSKQSQGNTYSLNLETNCFGDLDPAPEYDPTPEPDLPKEDDKCTKVSNNLMACLGDGTTCDANGSCSEQCGYVNGTFMCFAECTGDQCDGDDLPTPDPDKPTPEFCTANPTDSSCITVPTPCTGADCTPTDGGDSGTGSGGGGVATDLSPVVEQLQDLNDKLAISTKREDGEVELGSLDTIFDQDSIDELKGKTEDIQSDISDFFNSTKTELSSMFNFSGGGGSYAPITFAFTYGTYSSKIWEYFTDNVAIIAAAIMFLAYLMAARIVLE